MLNLSKCFFPLYYDTFTLPRRRRSRRRRTRRRRRRRRRRSRRRRTRRRKRIVYVGEK